MKKMFASSWAAAGAAANPVSAMAAKILVPVKCFLIVILAPPYEMAGITRVSPIFSVTLTAIRDLVPLWYRCKDFIPSPLTRRLAFCPIWNSLP
jgi:hypothetical protein